MAPVDSVNLSSLLVRHMKEAKVLKQDLAALTGLSMPTIRSFIRNRTQPNRRTRESIEDYLRDVGVLTRLGLPTTPNEENPHALSEKERRFIIYAFYHAHGSDTQKDKLLDKILARFS